jgi:hypothetical protein
MTITPCAPSPPSAFCHEKVVTSQQDQGRGMAYTALVASTSVRPLRSLGMAASCGMLTPEVVPFHVIITSQSKSTRERSGRWP